MLGSKNRVIETLRTVSSRQITEIGRLNGYIAAIQAINERLARDLYAQEEANAALYGRLDRVRAALDDDTTSGWEGV